MTKDKSVTDPSPYEILDLDPGVRMDEISNDVYKKALLRWGNKYVRQIVDAYTHLRDPIKRLCIDAFFYQREKDRRVKFLPVADEEIAADQGAKADTALNLRDIKHYDMIGVE